MKKIAVVTGGAGFIGSHLTELLLAQDYIVYVIDNLSNSSLDNLTSIKSHKSLNFVQQDIASNGSWMKILNTADEIYHLAGLAAIVPSIEDPRQYFFSNVLGTLNVLEAASLNSKIIYAASSSCYGIPTIYPTPETSQLRPEYPYALTKLQGEQLCLHWNKVYKRFVKSLRLFNVYGLRSRANSTYGAMFGVFLAQKLAQVPLTIVGDGTQSRDFVYVTDVAQAFFMAARTTSTQTVYNVGSGRTISINYIAQLLDCPTVYIPKRPGEPDVTHADISQITNDIGWTPTIDIDQGVRILLDNLELWRNAPIWHPGDIEKATANWFKYLS